MYDKILILINYVSHDSVLRTVYVKRPYIIEHVPPVHVRRAN
jgi:hypothetical protein